MSGADDLYVGGWLGGERHGYGVLAADRSVYMGVWLDGARHGPGAVLYPDGVVCVGTFDSDAMVGAGVLRSADDAEFTGMFSGECQLQGKGVLRLASGDRLTGTFAGHWMDKAGLRVNGVLEKAVQQFKPASVRHPPVRSKTLFESAVQDHYLEVLDLATL